MSAGCGVEAMVSAAYKPLHVDSLWSQSTCGDEEEEEEEEEDEVDST
jgi:hypothetical protein